MKKILISIVLFASLLIVVPTQAAQAHTEEKTTLAHVNHFVSSILFFDVAGGNITVPKVTRAGEPILDETGAQVLRTIELPFLIVILAFGALFFSFYHSFVNVRGFFHALNVVRGKYDNADDHGEISHFRALTSALSGTIGLGNIAGVAVAIQVGGPGAVLWMILLALFGMSAKFNSCTLSQIYRKYNPDGSISGGPMYYLDIGLREKGGLYAPLGKILGLIFAVFIMGGSLGGGNMFQANQTVEAFQHAFALPESSKWIIGSIMSFSIGLVIIGGIKRIGAATSKIVPLMCGIYIVASLVVIIANIDAVPSSLALIVTMGLGGDAVFGGIVGVAVKGLTRAGFSNEAGLGSAAIAHAAAKTNEPIREGLVAMIGPIIDTVIVCVMTALVIIVTGTWQNPELAAAGGNLGVTLTSEAFRTVIPWFPYVLTICIALFAYSTAISWYYYGERGWVYILDHFGEGVGQKTLIFFRTLFICFTMIGSINHLSEVLEFSDLMILSLGFPNIIGSIFLASIVRTKMKDYFRRLNAGEFG